MANAPADENPNGELDRRRAKVIGANPSIGEAESVESEVQEEGGDDIEALLELLRELVDAPAVSRLVDAVSKRIEQDEARHGRELEFRRVVQDSTAKFYSSNRVFFLVGLGMCFVFLGYVMWIFRADKETLLPVLTAVIGLVAGAGGGWIFGQQRPQASGTN